MARPPLAVPALHPRRAVVWLACLGVTALASAADPIGAATPGTGAADECRGGGTQPGCRARPFVTTNDLAWSGNGFAKPAVVKDNLGPAMHNAANLTDGAYGNGSSWIGATAGSWAKIDLGRMAFIDGVRFGRDRTGGFDDRDPGAFSVWVATSDVYATGNEANDAADYTKVYDSATQGFSGTIKGNATIAASFPRTTARYVKVVFATSGAAIDEIEVSGAPGLSIGYAAATVGDPECRPGATAPGCAAQPFDRSADLAWTGNGARPAVTRETIANAPIHTAANLNDGSYGNGSSWIGTGLGSWAKVDLGGVKSISAIRFGRDRTGGFDDRDPGQFEIWVAKSDAVYASGDASADDVEYTKVYASTPGAFSGQVVGPRSVVVEFPPVDAQFVKVVWTAIGAAIDELEVISGPVSAPDINLTPLGVVSQSTVVLDADARRAADGDRSGVFSKGSVTHTVGAPNQWLQVALGGLLTVNRVDLYNRTDCCGDRLNKAKVELTLSPCDADNPSVVASSTLPATVGAMASVSFPDSPVGAFVCVRNAGSDPLSVAEIEVMGPRPIPDGVPDTCEAPPGPTDAPAGTSLSATLGAAEPSALVVDTDRLWNPGKVLRVCYIAHLDLQPDNACGLESGWSAVKDTGSWGKQFLHLDSEIKEVVDDNSAAQDFGFIARHAMVWSRYANVRFDFLGKCQNGSPADIVVSMDHTAHVGGYWDPNIGGPGREPCTAGQRCKPNLILNRESGATVVHEFGHALGLRHEQQNPKIDWHYDEAAMTAAGEDLYQWKALTGDNIVASSFDPYSIMLYRIPYKYIQGGKAACKEMYPSYNLNRCNSHLSPSDIANIRKVYPFKGARDLTFGNTPGAMFLYTVHEESAGEYHLSGPTPYDTVIKPVSSDQLVAVTPHASDSPWLVSTNGDVKDVSTQAKVGNLWGHNTALTGPEGAISRSAWAAAGDVVNGFARLDASRSLVVRPEGSIQAVDLVDGKFVSSGVVFPASQGPFRSVCGSPSSVYTLDLGGKIARYKPGSNGWARDTSFSAQQLGAREIACRGDDLIFTLAFDGSLRAFEPGKPAMPIGQMTGARGLAALEYGVVGVYDPPSATLYEHREFGGSSRLLTDNTPDLSKVGFDNTAGAMTNAGRPSAVSVYDKPGYGGACKTYGSSVHSFSDMGFENDDVSAVKLGTVCSYTTDAAQNGVFYDAWGSECPVGGVLAGDRCKILSVPGNLLHGMSGKKALVNYDPTACAANGGAMTTMSFGGMSATWCGIELP